MIDINHNMVKGCELCDVFSSIDNYELIYPTSKAEVNSGDYIIIQCTECDNYILILRDHTEIITSEMFGKILFSVRKLFPKSIKLDTSVRHCGDHFHCHIYVNK